MITTITRDELLRMRASNEPFTLVDVLPRDHYDQEHIPGAISLPLAQIRRDARALLPREGTIVVYCGSFDCQASTAAATTLISMGYEHVLDYKGGLKDYKEGGLPLQGSLHECASCASCCSCD